MGYFIMAYGRRIEDEAREAMASFYLFQQLLVAKHNNADVALGTYGAKDPSDFF